MQQSNKRSRLLRMEGGLYPENLSFEELKVIESSGKMIVKPEFYSLKVIGINELVKFVFVFILIGCKVFANRVLCS